MGEPTHIHAEGGSLAAGEIHGDVKFYTTAPPPVDPTIDELLSQNIFDTAEWLRTAALGKAVHLLATAPVTTGARLLDALKEHHPDRVIELLAASDNGRATEIVDAMRGGAEVADVPEAAHAILGHASNHPTGKDLGPRQGGLRRAVPSPRGTTGYFWVYANGAITWSANGGARTTMGPILEFHRHRSGTRGYLGFPLSDEHTAARSRDGTSGSFQRFEFYRDFASDVADRIGTVCGATVYYSETHGAHATRGRIGEYHERLRGTAGWLGFPTSGETDAAGAKRQFFEGGVVYKSTAPASAEAIGVRRDIADYHEAQGGVEGRLGLPAGDEWSLVSSLGTKGRAQKFAAGERPDTATVYVLGEGRFDGFCHVWGEIGELYDRLDAATGWLGLPRSGEIDGRIGADAPWRCFQQFEGGAIFWSKEHRAIATSAVVAYLVDERTGFPITHERELVEADGTRTGEKVQFFEHAVITVRDGVPRAWYTRAGSPTATSGADR